MNTKEMIEVMQAYEDGKAIQVLFNNKNDWCDIVTETVKWNWFHYKYRIKPTPIYRPYKPEELMQLKGKWLKSKNGVLVAVIEIYPDRITLGNTGYETAQSIFDYWTHEDDSPCGVLEE